VAPVRVVVVGATGNVGTAVLRRLRSEEGVEIVGVVRQVPPADAPPPYGGVEWHAVDVAEPSSTAALTAAFAGADAVIHLPWLLQPNHDERVMAATNIGGLQHVLAAVVAARVPHAVVVSSVGAYSPGPKRRRVDESWPTGGLPSSHYALHKAVNERILDRFEQEHPEVVVARIRPGLVMQGTVGEELRALFVGPFVPVRWLGRIPLLVLPLPPRTISQVVHADDLADAFARTVLRRASGAFNIAAEPVIGPRDVAAVLKARWLPVRIAPVRGLVWLAWHLRLVAVDPGWIDIATSVPLMSTERARAELEWEPKKDAVDALREAVRGVSDRTTSAGSPHLGGAASR
jgi:nucleoside-diphosphate-sugar epimerase